MVGNKRAAPRAAACPHCYLLCSHNMKQHAKVTVMLLSLISQSKVLLRALKVDPHSYFITVTETLLWQSDNITVLLNAYKDVGI